VRRTAVGERWTAWRRTRARRLRAAAWPLLQTATAAALAWYFARSVLDHPQPFFAPIAAAVSMGAAVGSRWRQAVRLIAGVAVGIVVADLIVGLLGTGPAAIGVVVLLAMGAAAAVTDQPMFINQAGASAILVVALHRHGTGGQRLVDAVTGGASALLVSQLIFPPRPLRRIDDGVARVLEALGDALRGAAEAVEDRRHVDAGWLVELNQRVHARLAALGAARQQALDIARWAPLRRPSLPEVEAARGRAAHAYLLANTVLSLVRGTGGRLSEKVPPPDWLAGAERDLADACSILAARPGEADRLRARNLALRAAAAAAGSEPAAPVKIGSRVRGAANDLLRVMGDSATLQA
jgi:uncharacterized membrane protein YgaE (UPF0421/DUF939 family)